MAKDMLEAPNQGTACRRFIAFRVGVAGCPASACYRWAHNTFPARSLAGWLTSFDQRVQYCLAHQSASTQIRQFAGGIKIRGVCEQGHRRFKEEPGLNHFEGRMEGVIAERANMHSHRGLSTEPAPKANQREKRNRHPAVSAQFGADRTCDH